MIKNIAKGYKSLIASTVKILLLIAVCAGLGFSIVYPLWKWATISPKSYTTACLCLLAAAALFLAVKSFLRLGAKKWLVRLAKLLTVFAGLGFITFSVIRGNRLAALVAAPLVFILYGLLAIGFKEK
ncbi:MAG: hypothetical protein II103_03595 [Treponema sp.]|jgi:hypothetical protein|nr:hypothetical protein [Treponema sp.]MBQ1643596.1 hypothetical protein [Treponema sp.]MBQ1671220.1 hypothetical protein [Treponema sp.]MBQ1727799.1 hypothetical protein [Treponema sp.]MBQ1870196.1 hypothetical protein [Treponema sp.]